GVLLEHQARPTSARHIPATGARKNPRQGSPWRGLRKAGEGIRTLPESALAGSPAGGDSHIASHDLQDVIFAWPRLTPDQRAAVLAVVRATPHQHPPIVTPPPPPSP